MASSDFSTEKVNAMERGGNGSANISSDEQLRNVLTNTMSISPEMFERLYLSPKNEVKGDLRKTFANPTPMAIMGFSVGVLPLSIELMGWRGSGGDGVATATCSIFFGGVLLILAGLLEFVLGNNFPFLVFMGYGAHFLSFANTFLPGWREEAFYISEYGAKKGAAAFTVSFGYYPVALGLLSLIFLLGALRTNLIFVLIFVCATTAFGFATAALFYTAQGHTDIGTKCLVATGACFFGADMLGWYLFLGMMIETMDLPLPAPPVFDLSTVIKGKSTRNGGMKQE